MTTCKDYQISPTKGVKRARSKNKKARIECASSFTRRSQIPFQGEKKMPNQNHYDVIIIGTGAGGGTLAYRLAPSGKKILLLERGGYVPREKDNWSTRAVNLDGKYNTKETWMDMGGGALHPHTNYFVGGNTKFYGAALFRLRKEDFGEIRHHGGMSPAWPIGYDELEP